MDLKPSFRDRNGPLQLSTVLKTMRTSELTGEDVVEGFTCPVAQLFE